MPLQRARKDLLLLNTHHMNQCWWHQSTNNARSHSSYCEQHQNQCAEHLQAIHKASATNKRNININALSFKSMHRVSTVSVEDINNQCTHCQQPMRIASDFLMLGFSRTKTFTFCSMPLTPVILRGAEGEVAESILPESTLSKGLWRDRP